MARASSICIRTGCYEYAVKDGRCDEHRLTHGWGTSNRVKPHGWARMRTRVLRRDRNTCVICGSYARVVDHLLAQEFGGSDKQPNLRAMCTRCHAAKTQDEAAVGRAVTRMTANNRAEAISQLVSRWS